jgi:hypothetical protein
VTLHRTVDMFVRGGTLFALGAVVFATWDAEPSPTVAPWAPTVECPVERCTAEECRGIADAECERHVGLGHEAMSVCVKLEVEEP